jgi:polysaccharide export outer membrane protein
MRCFLCSLLLCAFILSLSACGGDYSAKTPPAVDLQAQKKNDRLNEALVISAAAASQSQPSVGYLIGPEDILDIDANNVDELKKSVRVNTSGDITLPLVGVLRVKGMTPSQVEKEITRRLDHYVEQPVVNVTVKEYRSQRISVVGAVRNPQVFAITGQRYLLDMLMMAGGLSNDAGRVCYIIRPEPHEDGEKHRAGTIIVDLDELLIKGNYGLNLPVYANDIVNVSKGGVIFVDGEVKAPGSYMLSAKTTLAEAITMAKGVTPEAQLGDVRIFRDNGKGERDVIAADYADIRSGKKPDIMLEENDIVIVPKSGLKSFFGSFINTVRGFVSLGTYTVFR